MTSVTHIHIMIVLILIMSRSVVQRVEMDSLCSKVHVTTVEMFMVIIVVVVMMPCMGS